MPTSCFTVNNVYDAERNSVNDHFDGIWRIIWRVKVPQRCRVFLWMVFHERIMTNEVLAMFKIASNSFCSLCNAAVESCLHVL